MRTRTRLFVLIAFVDLLACERPAQPHFASAFEIQSIVTCKWARPIG